MTIAAADIPRLLAALEADPAADVLLVLEEQWSGPASWDLERRTRESGVPVKLSVWSG